MYRDPRSGAHLYETLQQKFEINTFDPVLASLEMPPGTHYRSDFSELLKMMKRNCNAEVSIKIRLYYTCYCLYSIWQFFCMVFCMDH